MKVQKLKTILLKHLPLAPLLLTAVLVISAALVAPGSRNLELCGSNAVCSNAPVELASQCGNGSGDAVTTSINFGCQGNSCTNGNSSGYCKTPHNGIIDLLFAIIRFLSAGVGLVIVASMVVGGIQYIVSRGDPNATGLAVKRLVSSAVALLIFIFAYAILNFVIPGGFFQ